LRQPALRSADVLRRHRTDRTAGVPDLVLIVRPHMSVNTRVVTLACAVAIAASLSVLLGAHGRDARYVDPVAWQKPHIARALAASRSELGLSGSKLRLDTKQVGESRCAVGSLFAVDVDDSYAFDIDEPVDITVTYAPELTTAPFAVAWDRNGGDGY